MVTFDYNIPEKTITVVFHGRMDAVATLKLNEILGAEQDLKDRKPGDRLVFDLKEVDFISSSFIRICVGYAKLAGTGKFSVTHCQPFVRKTIQISGLDEVLNIN